MKDSMFQAFMAVSDHGSCLSHKCVLEGHRPHRDSLETILVGIGISLGAESRAGLHDW
jgi:hypothetical protein